ncbi:TetR family transcriptional regulator [Endozoicomonas sp. (ex Bugula neritina AB1)]|nr:TetR family transcriptional regulator [Endozoicomonas sp. (ex Bugula neritina AB1)]
MTENKKPYHHGNLRQSLIDQATVMISEVGVEKLSMRGLAQVAGVSRTAAYHHFKDKNELLCAIAEQGFTHWLEMFSGLEQQTPERLEEWLTQFVRAYVDFACEYQEEYDLMFGRPIWKAGEPTDSLRQQAAECFHRYVLFIEQWQKIGVFSNEIEALRLTQVSWSTLHGMCRLLNDGIYLDRASLDAMCQAVVQILTGLVNNAKKS